MLLFPLLLLGCPNGNPDDGLPSCEELACQGGAVCLDGACRPRACAEADCPEGTVCQGGPLCVLESEATRPVCLQIGCIDGYLCQEGPLCRDPREDQDGDGAPSQIDCDDGDASRWPGNEEICDGVDNDCDGASDDDAPCLEGWLCCGSAGCVDPTTDREHCGACGRECEIYQACEESQCIDAPAPIVTGVSPDPLQTGIWFGRDEEAELIISGRYLLGYATVYLESEAGSEAAPFEVVTSAGGRAYVLDQPHLIDGAQLPGGNAWLRVVRNDGAESDPFELLVEGAAAPVVTSISPDPMPVGEETTISCYGTGFWGAPRLYIAPVETGSELHELPVQWVSETWVRTSQVELDPSTFTAGPWLAIVENPDGVQSEPYPFTVDAAAPPTLTNASPEEASIGSVLSLEVFGYDFFGRPTVHLAPLDAPDDPLPPFQVDLVDFRRLVTAPIDFSPSLFAPGRYSLWVENPDETASNALRFEVLE